MCLSFFPSLLFIALLKEGIKKIHTKIGTITDDSTLQQKKSDQTDTKSIIEYFEKNMNTYEILGKPTQKKEYTKQKIKN